MVLTAMDYEGVDNQNGSELWQKLVSLKNTISSTPLDPTIVKRCIIQTEVKRAEQSNVLPENRLFVNSNQNLGYGTDQQDAKEFFMCLDENEKDWVDVFNFFKIGTQSETECSHCGNISRQQNCNNISTFIRLHCPPQNTTLKAYLESKMNGFEVTENWRDESGCNLVTIGKNKNRISDMSCINFVIFVIDRLMKIGNQLHIIETKIQAEMNECIILEDSNGNSANFQLLSVIHHSGNVVVQAETRGHYYADVKNVNNDNWYRTSDSNQPEDLSNKRLTENGYIYLLKKMYIDTNSVVVEHIHK